MRKVPPRLTEPPIDGGGDLTCRIALRAIYAWEAAQFRAQCVGRKGWRACTHLVETFWLAGRPVLFLHPRKDIGD